MGIVAAMASSRTVGVVAATAAALLLAVLVSVVEGNTSCFADYAISRLYKTKYDVCSKNNTAISELAGTKFFEIMNVSLSAPYDPKVRRHVLWRNHQVQVCLTGRANTLTEKVNFLQNPAFGYVLFPLIPLDSPFCEIDKNTCTNMQIGPQNDQKCSADAALQPGQEFCTCSNIKVPAVALPGLDVDITWIVMSTENEPKKSDCEVQRGTEQLAGKGKKKVVCIKIP